MGARTSEFWSSFVELGEENAWRCVDLRPLCVMEIPFVVLEAGESHMKTCQKSRASFHEQMTTILLRTGYSKLP